MLKISESGPPAPLESLLSSRSWRCFRRRLKNKRPIGGVLVLSNPLLVFFLFINCYCLLLKCFFLGSKSLYNFPLLSLLLQIEGFFSGIAIFLLHFFHFYIKLLNDGCC